MGMKEMRLGSSAKMRRMMSMIRRSCLRTGAVRKACGALSKLSSPVFHRVAGRCWKTLPGAGQRPQGGVRCCGTRRCSPRHCVEGGKHVWEQKTKRQWSRNQEFKWQV